jgi:RNA polymerase sigma-70 factor, ECF subfamily
MGLWETESESTTSCYIRAMNRADSPDRKPTDEPDDAARAGSRQEIDRLLARHLPGLTAFVRLRLGPVIRSNESCADIVQSACREVLVHADRFQFGGDSNFRNWLYTTALRKITDRKRYWLAEKRRAPRDARTAKEPGASEDQVTDCYRSAFTSPSQAAMKREDIDALERAFDRLSAEDREVVVLARIVGMTAAEIAREKNQTVGSVRTRLSRAMARLAVLMRKGNQDG